LNMYLLLPGKNGTIGKLGKSREFSILKFGLRV